MGNNGQRCCGGDSGAGGSGSKDEERERLEQEKKDRKKEVKLPPDILIPKEILIIQVNIQKTVMFKECCLIIIPAM